MYRIIVKNARAIKQDIYNRSVLQKLSMTDQHDGKCFSSDLSELRSVDCFYSKAASFFYYGIKDDGQYKERNNDNQTGTSMWWLS